MRFNFLLAVIPALAMAQDLDSLISQATAFLTQSDVQSAISAASSLANDPSFSSLVGSITSAYSSEIASITSQYGTDYASYTSAFGSYTSEAGATASAAAAGGSGGDRVVIPAMGVVGAGILGLAAYL
jgi:hypothetical protein